MSRNPIDVIDRGFDELRARQDKQDEKIDQTHEWISSVESKVNTARTHGPGEDNLVPAIPDAFRRHIEIAKRLGYKDAVNNTAKCLWMYAMIQAKRAAIHPGRTTPGQWLEVADNLERGWGYDPAQKALLGDAAAGGGSIIATPVEAELMRLIQDNTIIRPLATKIVMTSLTHQIPVENSNVIAYIVAENATITDSMPATAFASRALTARKFAGLATVTNELLDDNIIGLNQYVFAAIAEQIGRLEDTGALEGGVAGVQNFSGVNYAAGVNQFTLGTTTVTGGSIPTYAELVQLVYTAQQMATRAGAGFFMTPNCFKNVVGLTDTTGQPIFSFANVPGAIPSFIGGYPVYLVSSLSTQWTNGSNGSSASKMYYGPPSKIIFGDATGMSFDLDPYFFFDTVKTRIRVLKRTGIICPVGSFFTIANGARMF